jgi:glyoxylase-like metal-dependent hydrolase (beta-lactamase superfamily II)
MKQILPNLWELDEIGNTVHCYLWEWSKGVTLIDTGMPQNAQTILEAIVKRGYALHQVKRILITHVDLDHSGNAAQIKQATGAKVACHSVESETLAKPSRRQPAALYLRPIFWCLAWLPAFTHRPLRSDELLVDGQQLPEGFTVIHTPGHSPGHIALLHKERRFLIAGDALVNTGNHLRANTSPFTPDKRNAQRSIWKLAKKYGDDFDAIVFGHGDPILQGGGHKVKALASQLFSSEV